MRVDNFGTSCEIIWDWAMNVLRKSCYDSRTVTRTNAERRSLESISRCFVSGHHFLRVCRLPDGYIQAHVAPAGVKITASMFPTQTIAYGEYLRLFVRSNFILEYGHLKFIFQIVILIFWSYYWSLTRSLKSNISLKVSTMTNWRLIFIEFLIRPYSIHR